MPHHCAKLLQHVTEKFLKLRRLYVHAPAFRVGSQLLVSCAPPRDTLGWCRIVVAGAASAFIATLVPVWHTNGRAASSNCEGTVQHWRLGVQVLPTDLGEHFCNSGDLLAEGLSAGCKLVWFFRHGQSTANAAFAAATAADRQDGHADGEGESFMRYKADIAYIDAPLTSAGLAQAVAAQQKIEAWKVQPSLIVCSPLTRALQTAAIIFEPLLASGAARLVVRPELREFFGDLMEARGRTLPDLRRCPQLRALAQWPAVDAALSEAATADWQALWDEQWAEGAHGAWQEHCEDGRRMEAFGRWLAAQPDTHIATVSHWGTINNFLNRQPWAESAPPRRELPWAHDASAWPPGGLARVFEVPNCGWIAVRMS